MSPSPGPSSPNGAAAAPLGRRERMLLAALAAVLAVLLFWWRGGLHPEAALERLARQSPELGTALTDGRPTLVEFYADWCEACRAMAPAMEALERGHRDSLDVVLLNVDNPRWQPEVERYGVNGIPQLELFDAAGQSVGRSIGARRPLELEAITTALVEGKPLPQLAGVGATSSLRGAESEPESALASVSSPADPSSARPSGSDSGALGSGAGSATAGARPAEAMPPDAVLASAAPTVAGPDLESAAAGSSALPSQGAAAQSPTSPAAAAGNNAGRPSFTQPGGRPSSIGPRSHG